MSATAPILGGTTLPGVNRDGYKETIAYLGGQAEMASGVLAFDLFSTNQKRRVELLWVALTEAEVTTVLTAYALLRTASQNFTPPVGSAIVVQRDGDPTVTWYPAASGPRADVTMKLREL